METWRALSKAAAQPTIIRSETPQAWVAEAFQDVGAHLSQMLRRVQHRPEQQPPSEGAW